jgi:hypothetical protein
MPLHSAITTQSELHQPKGVASASDNTVYVADGAESGSWDYLCKEVSTGSFTNTTSKEITGLGDFAVVYLTVPFIESSSTTNHWIQMQVGNDSGYTTSTRYYSYNWNYQDNSSNTAATSWRVAYSLDTNLALWGEQTLVVCVTNFNKDYNSVMTSYENLDREQSTNALVYPGTGLIKESKSYNKLRLTANYSFDANDMTVVGIRG